MNNNVTTNMKAIRKLSKLLTEKGYIAYITRIQDDLHHFDMLVMEKDTNSPSAYVCVSYKVDANDEFQYLVYKGAILNLPSQFIRVHELIEKGGE